jgi:uncharacterized cupin superfamily protein/protein tyrosine phosphatase (PTP) superfamily phosphohydrolase (DUF442 family)
MPRPPGGDRLDGEMAALRAAGADVLVALPTHAEWHDLGLTDEPAAAARAGLAFHHFPIPDLGTPEAPVTPLIHALTGALRQGRTVVIHCRAGIGRSSLIAGAVLVALGATPARAWAAITEARGVPVPETAGQGRWLDDYAARMPSSLPAGTPDVRTVALESIGPWPPHGALAGEPVAAGLVLSSDDLVETGVWECTPGRFTSRRDGTCEMMHFVAGAGTLTDADGTAHEIRPGTARFLPDGWSGEFHITETVRKTYVSVKTR